MPSVAEVSIQQAFDCINHEGHNQTLRISDYVPTSFPTQ